MYVCACPPAVSTNSMHGLAERLWSVLSERRAEGADASTMQHLVPTAVSLGVYVANHIAHGLVFYPFHVHVPQRTLSTRNTWSSSKTRSSCFCWGQRC